MPSPPPQGTNVLEFLERLNMEHGAEAPEQGFGFGACCRCAVAFDDFEIIAILSSLAAHRLRRTRRDASVSGRFREAKTGERILKTLRLGQKHLQKHLPRALVPGAYDGPRAHGAHRRLEGSSSRRPVALHMRLSFVACARGRLAGCACCSCSALGVGWSRSL